MRSTEARTADRHPAAAPVAAGPGAPCPKRIFLDSSVTVGVATFWGRNELVDMPVNEIAPAANRQGARAYKNATENLISIIRDRDEVFLRLRYTF